MTTKERQTNRATRIRKLMRDANLTPKELSHKMGKSDNSVSNVLYRLEQGHNVRKKTIARLKDAIKKHGKFPVQESLPLDKRETHPPLVKPAPQIIAALPWPSRAMETAQKMVDDLRAHRDKLVARTEELTRTIETIEETFLK